MRMINYNKMNSNICRYKFKDTEMQDSEELENIEANMDKEQKVRKSKTLKGKKIGTKEKRMLKTEKLQQAAKEFQQGKFKSLQYELFTYIIHL